MINEAIKCDNCYKVDMMNLWMMDGSICAPKGWQFLTISNGLNMSKTHHFCSPICLIKWSGSL
jgi:hypothetical protein